MFAKTNRRRHVNNPFDEFGFSKMRHSVVAPLELGTGEPVTVRQDGNICYNHRGILRHVDEAREVSI